MLGKKLVKDKEKLINGLNTSGRFQNGQENRIKPITEVRIS
jgi:hypothetical protein